MVEIVSTSIQRRVTTRRVTRSTAGQAPPPAEVVEYVVAKVGVPGRDLVTHIINLELKRGVSQRG